MGEDPKKPVMSYSLEFPNEQKRIAIVMEKERIKTEEGAKEFLESHPNYFSVGFQFWGVQPKPNPLEEKVHSSE